MEEIKRLVYSRELRWNEIMIIAMRLFLENIKVIAAGTLAHWSAPQYFADTDSRQGIEPDGTFSAGVIGEHHIISPRISDADAADDDK